MSWLNTLLWWQWSLLAAVPIGIVLLYFLKLKRQPLEVPSTYLWRRTVEDLHVNSIWQRLRRNLLLLLQLLLIALAVLALLRPGWQTAELTGHRFVFAIDNSASMRAADSQPDRLSAAKQGALKLVDQMQAGDVAMVIAFADVAEVVQPFTESRRALRRGINRILPSDRPTDVREALQAAAGLANPGYTRLEQEQAVDEAMPATLYVLSDGGFAAVGEFDLGNLRPEYLPVGTPGAANCGIVAFATQRNPERPEQLQAFARVENFSDTAVELELELFLENESVDVAALSLAARQSGSWTFDLPDLDEAELKLVLTPDDVLSADNTAYAVLNRPRPADVVLVTPGNRPLELALQTPEATKIAQLQVLAPEVLDEADKTDFQKQAAAGAFDLVIFDQCAPQVMPAANTMFIGTLPPDGRWRQVEQPGSRDIIDLDRAHPLTQLVEMDYVKIADAVRLVPPPGSTTLMDAGIGPVCAIAPRDHFQDLVLGFTLLDTTPTGAQPNTTWPLRPSFPVFALNVLAYLGGGETDTDAPAVRIGQAVPLRAPGYVDSMTVVTPGGTKHVIERAGTGNFVFTQTDRLGVYRVREGGRPEYVQRFTVNLLDARESDIAPRTSISVGHETVTGTVQLQAVRRELWRWLAGGMLVLLLLEWYIYNRRVYL